MAKLIGGKVAIPSASTYTTLTALAGITGLVGPRFKGVISFPSSNAGAANVIKTTISGADDIVCAAGTYHEFNAVDMDSVQIKGTITDYVNILGETV